MKIPKSWKDIKVGQFQDSLPYYKKAIEETDPIKSLDNWAIVIAILTNSQLDAIQSMDINELKAIIKRLSFLANVPNSGTKRFTLYHKGVLYKAPKDAKEFNTSRYVDYKTFLGKEGGFIANLHLILATIYSPYVGGKGQTFEQRANDFKDVSMGRIYQTVFFYTKAYRNSIKRIQDYGLKMVEKKNKEIQSQVMAELKETLESIGVG